MRAHLCALAVVFVLTREFDIRKALNDFGDA
jgi:hypothetical protein